ncbi:Probable ribonuclease VapC32 [Bordetella ansorpii]|uniref:Probable ribonuclease VapC32 n=1 Tax=Bordetella ansorpii TaxID=288768 RepID=A0A157KPK7_9BORD|nr:type II toxin-antitoxin system VapC family toxin [Bordetella ansorpii]SAH86290.1 Probable ribonuclease VapC32 [Bordetella ansorpii]
MMLVDSAIWIDHFDGRNTSLQPLLEQDGVLTHPLVITEIALGNLPQRDSTLQILQNLPHIEEASHAEALALLHSQRLDGSGIGCVDLHLLCAVKRRPGTRLWTRDRKLNKAATAMGLAGHPAAA